MKNEAATTVDEVEYSETKYWLTGVAETDVRQVGIITALVRLLDAEIRLVL